MTTKTRFEELVDEEEEKIEAAVKARRRAKAMASAGYRLRMEQDAARPLDELAARLGPTYTLLGLAWPDCPAKHRYDGEAVYVKAPWSIKPDGVYRTLSRLRQPMPVLAFEATNPGISEGLTAVEGLYDYRICSPVWPVRRPDRGHGWQWAVRTKAWKTVEVPVRDDLGNAVDLVDALTGHGATFNPEAATVTTVGAMTGDRDTRTHTARQLFSEFLDHIGGQIL